MRAHLSQEATAVLAALPGADVVETGHAAFPWRVTASWNLGFRVQQYLDQWGAPYQIDAHTPVPIIEGVAANQVVPVQDIPELRHEGVPPLTEFQTEGLPYFQERMGGLAHWACGSGKTRMGILWALSVPGKVLVITRSHTVPQWRDEVHKWCKPDTVHVECVHGTRGYRSAYKPKTVQMAKLLVPGDEALRKWAEARTSLEAVPGARLRMHPDEALERLSRTPGKTMKAKVLALDEGPLPIKVLGKALARRMVEAGIIELLDLSVENVPKPPKSLRDIVDTLRPRASTTKGMNRKHLGALVDLGVVRVWEQPLPDYKPWRVISEQRGGEVILEYDREQDALAALDALETRLDVPAHTRIVVVGWAIVSARRRALARWKPDSVVVDESHRAKAPSRWEAVKEPNGRLRYVLKANQSASAMYLCHQAKRVLELSATPMPDRPRDLWAQGDLYDPRGFSKKFKIFALRYCAGHYNRWDHFDSRGVSNAEELRQRMSFFTHHVSKERSHAALPPLRRQITYLEPKELAAVRSLGKRPTTRAGILELRSQLAAEAKRPYLVGRALDLVKEDGLRVCVVSGTHEAVERLGADIAKGLNRKPVRPVKLWVSHGGTHDAQARRRLVREEIEPHPGPWILVGTLDAWGEAIDGLQRTQRVLCGYLPWNLLLEQFEGRFSRHGSIEECIIEYVIARYTIDIPVLDQILAKAEGAGAVLPPTAMQDLARDLAGDGDRQAVLNRLADKLLRAADDLEQGWRESVEARKKANVPGDLEDLEGYLDEAEAPPEALEVGAS